jgi:hypothetical protein
MAEAQKIEVKADDVKVIDSNDVIEIFADGQFGSMVGDGILKINLTTVGFDVAKNEPYRRVVARLVMPVNQFKQMVTQILPTLPV